MSYVLYTVVLLCAVLAGTTALSNPVSIAGRGGSDSSFTFFHVSDLHLNPYYDPNAPPATYCKNEALYEQPGRARRSLSKGSASGLRRFPFGKFGCDTPPLLLNETLKAMAETNDDPLFVAVGGDWCGHGMPNSSVVFAMLEEAAYLVHQHFPNAAVLPAIGNNDLTDDYHLPVDVETMWMDDIADMWESKGWLNSTQADSYREGGYYAASFLDDELVVLVLNTVVYSSGLRATNDSSEWAPTPPEELPADPNKQFQWLESQLQQIRRNGQQAILSYHIPPGPDAWDDSALWHEKFTLPFNALVLEYHDVIIAHLGAHTHADEMKMFRVSPDDTPQSVALLNPAVSPVFNNNPAFRIYTGSNSNGEVVLDNYFQYYVDLVKANQQESVKFELEYEVQKAYGVSEISAKSMFSVVEELAQNTKLYDQWLTRKFVSHAPNRNKMLCAIVHQSVAEYEKCAVLWSDQI